MEFREFVLQTRIEASVLGEWVQAGWLAPQRTGNAEEFSEVDLARAHLVRDLQQLGVNNEGIPVILDLVDQLHGLRRLVRELLSGIHAQPEAKRRQLVADLHDAMSEGIGDASGRSQTSERHKS
jgi:chaperone modulatory protein CbpM